MARCVILARHGRTRWNVDERVQGHKGEGLDQIGIQQSEALAYTLQALNLNIGLIVSSDLSRATQTAEIINRKLQLPIKKPDPRLRECGFGELEGMQDAEIVAKYEEHWVNLIRAWNGCYDFRPLGGEHHNDVIARHLEVFNELKADTVIDAALLVGHGRALNTVLQARYPHELLIERNCEYRVIVL